MTKQAHNRNRANIWSWRTTTLWAVFGLDLPNKFIVVRSTVKPKEKSPEEPSKD